MKVEFQFTDEILSNQEISLLVDEINKHSFISKMACLPPYVNVLKENAKTQKLHLLLIFHWVF